MYSNKKIPVLVYLSTEEIIAHTVHIGIFSFSPYLYILAGYTH